MKRKYEVTFTRSQKTEFVKKIWSESNRIAFEISQNPYSTHEEMVKIIAKSNLSFMAKMYAELLTNRTDREDLMEVSADLYVFFKDIEKLLVNLKESKFDQ